MYKHQTFIEQYVQDVVGFSSQYGNDVSITYTAVNIIGKPSKYPDYGDFPQCFVMRTYGPWWDEAPSRCIPFMPQSCNRTIGHDFVDVTFEHAVYPFKIDVYETYNPGAIIRIWASDEEEHWTLLWEGKSKELAPVSRIFSPDIKFIDFPTRLLRLEFNHSHLTYYTEIDAILLAGTTRPFQKDGVFFHGEFFGKVSSKVKDLDLQGIVPEVDINESIANLLNVELPSLLMKLDSETCLQSLTSSNIMTKKNKAITFDDLPDESCIKILSFLDMCSLCQCAQVNRRFHTLATDPLLYKELNLKMYWHCTRSESLRYLTIRCKFLQKLDLSWCGGLMSITSDDFINFIEGCGSNLTHIRLNSCAFMDSRCLVFLTYFCTYLKELGLGNCLEIHETGFWSLATLRHIERLDVYRTSITLRPLKAIIEASPELRYLNVGSCMHVSNMDEVAQALGQFSKNLISVDFWKTSSLTHVGVKALSRCSHLEEIDIGWCNGVGAPGDCLQMLARGCPRLKKLFLASLRGLTDKDLEAFIYLCPDLEQVDLLGIHSITSNICVQFLTRCCKLRLLDISFCSQVPDSEVTYWQMVFPRVSIKRSFQREELDVSYSNNQQLLLNLHSNERSRSVSS